MKSSYFLTLVFCLTLAACSPNEAKDESGIKDLSTPAKAGSELPRLTQSANGETYLSWVEKTGKNNKLLYAQLGPDEQWTESKVIAEGDNWFVNWADFPALMVNDNFMAAHWLQKSDNGTYDYDVRMSTSADGTDWSKSFIPHKDGVSAEHGFVSMLPLANDQYFATWLDGRNTKMSHEAGEMEHAGAMSLRAAILAADGTTMQEWELDDRTCDCCQTGAAMTPLGPVVIYRDRTENEIRDISIRRLVDNEWTESMPVSIDLWEIAGCPVNGPAIATSDKQLAVAWYTGAQQTPKVQLAISDDWGETFSQPILISEGNTLGRVGITTLNDGSFVVSWLQTQEDKAQIMLSKIDRTGTVMKTQKVIETSLERASGFPTITSTGNKVLLSLTDIKNEPQVLIKSITF